LEVLINSRCVKRRENFSSDVLKFRRHTDVCQGILVQNDGKFAVDAHIAELFRGSLIRPKIFRETLNNTAILYIAWRL